MKSVSDPCPKPQSSVSYTARVHQKFSVIIRAYITHCNYVSNKTTSFLERLLTSTGYITLLLRDRDTSIVLGLKQHFSFWFVFTLSMRRDMLVLYKCV